MKSLKEKIKVFFKEYKPVILFLSISLLIIFILIEILKNIKTSPVPPVTTEKFVLISYNKILYTNIETEDPRFKEALDSYKEGYLEKAKFLFQSIANSTTDKNLKKASLVNLASIFDDTGNYTLAIKYLNKALQISKKDGIIYHNLGIVYKHLGDYKNAIQSFKKAIEYKRFIKSYLSLASLYYYLDNYKKSLEIYKKCYSINPSLWEAKFNAGVICLKLNKIKQAIEIFQELLTSEAPDRIKKYVCKTTGFYYINKGELNKGLYYLRKGLRYKGKQDSGLYYKIGLIYYIKGDYKRALENFEISYRLNKKNIQTLSYLAELYYRFGELDKALEKYNLLLNRKKRKTEILFTVAEIYKKKKEYDKALDVYEQILGETQKIYEKKIALINAGGLLLEMGEYDKSLKYYLQALELFPDDAQIYYNLAVCYLKQKDIKTAQEYLKKALKVNKENPELYIFLARLYSLTGEKKKSIELLEQLINKQPYYLKGYLELGKIYLKIGHYDEAIAYFDVAEDLIKKEESKWKVYLLKGIALSKKGKLKEGLKFLLKSSLLSPYNEIINYNIGLIYYKLGNYKKGIKYFKRAIIAGTDKHIKALACVGLGNIYYKIGNKELALKNYKKALKFDSGITEAYYNIKFLKGEI